MRNKKYLYLLAVTGIAASSVFSLPVSASTDSSSGSAPGNWRSGQENKIPGIFGKVTAVSGTTITVTEGRDNKTYTIDASSATFTKNGESSSISDIAVGDMIMVEGTVNDLSVTATAVRIGGMGRGLQGGPQDEKGRGIVGTVASISGNTITVTSKKGGPDAATETIYTVDASGAKVTKDGATSSVSGISSGDTVMVRGTVNGTNITATSIAVGMPGNGQGPQDQGHFGQDSVVEGDGQPVVAGTVASVNGSTFTVTNNGSNTYTVDASGATVKKEGVESASYSNIAVGDKVVVQGSVSGTSVTASSVIDQTPVQQANADSSGNAGSNNGQPGFFGRIFNFLKGLFGF